MVREPNSCFVRRASRRGGDFRARRRASWTGSQRSWLWGRLWGLGSCPGDCFGIDSVGARSPEGWAESKAKFCCSHSQTSASLTGSCTALGGPSELSQEAQGSRPPDLHSHPLGRGGDFAQGGYPLWRVTMWKGWGGKIQSWGRSLWVQKQEPWAKSGYPPEGAERSEISLFRG